MGSMVVVALGGALGAVLRFFISNGVTLLWGKTFPFGTLVVNVIGSLLMGMLSEVLLMHHVAFMAEFRVAILVGFLGSLTTFSTFSLNILQLLEQGQFLKTCYYILLNVCGCLLAVWLGLSIVKALFAQSDGIMPWGNHVFPLALILIIGSIAFLFGVMVRLLNAEVVLAPEYSVLMQVIALGTFSTVSALYLILNIIEQQPLLKVEMPILLSIFLGNTVLCLAAVAIGYSIGKKVCAWWPRKYS